jgi:CheY-like chemotaxis protein
MNLEVIRGKTILVVDDEKDLREPLSEELTSLGARVFQASNGTEALAIVRSEKIDAVVSDIRMPGGDGVELLKNIKEYQYDFPVVMLITGFSDLSLEDAYHLGAEAILAKPFDLDELDLTVARILTPRVERWSCPVDPAQVKSVIEREFEGFSEALKDGCLRLGRGGLFISLKEKLPLSGPAVGFSVRFKSGDLLVLEGAGIIRWVRYQSDTKLPEGCGIEFECLSAETRARILEITESAQIKPFIPKH